ncbi:MAG: PIG-L domain-containing protein [unclassified Hahellaceae]|nr:PIG-L domain-containing protein [Hahellaceae bacterium]|tara:strand:+ start:23639 stop:24415 length:777 start_codon:yes stop_codon:yes gene_type:complete
MMSFARTLFDHLRENAEYRPGRTVADFGPTLVVAPHPDDESLGCGGTIALLRRYERPVHILFVSDGTMSHPNSLRFKKQVRRMIREEEAHAAAAVLNVAAQNLHFLRLPDTRIPYPGSEPETSQAFEAAVADVGHILDRVKPATVLLPWQYDEHRDHAASWHIGVSALNRSELPVRRLEYPMWGMERDCDSHANLLAQHDCVAIDIRNVVPEKQRAIAAHRSQVSGVFNDDPDGFVLDEALLSRFHNSFEYFLAERQP